MNFNGNKKLLNNKKENMMMSIFVNKTFILFSILFFTNYSIVAQENIESFCREKCERMQRSNFGYSRGTNMNFFSACYADCMSKNRRKTINNPTSNTRISTFACNHSESNECKEIGISSYSVKESMDRCKEGGGEVLEQCPRENIVGYCTIAIPFAEYAYHDFVYSEKGNVSVEDLEKNCLAANDPPATKASWTTVNGIKANKDIPKETNSTTNSNIDKKYGIVTAKGGLFLRQDCNRNSNKVILMKENVEVEILEEMNEEEIENLKARWYRIKYENHIGCSFGAYIKTKSSSGENTGCISGNCVNGTGTYLWANGDKYTGSFKNSKRNGKGILVWSDGEKYDGEFSNGIRQGQGNALYTNGDKYSGEFKNDKPNGQGTGELFNGDKYYGGFKDGKRHGQGTCDYYDGAQFVGEWRNGLPNGKGTYTYSFGAKFVGELKDGKLHGKGILYDPNGTIKEKGRWDNGKFIGDK